MGIKRYDHDPDTGSISAYPDGALIDYTDHLAALKQARIDAVRGFADKLITGSHIGLHGDYLWTDQINYLVDEEIKKINGEGDE